MSKQTTDELSTLAAKVLNGSYEPSAEDIRRLAACVLSQDEVKGKREA